MSNAAHLLADEVRAVAAAIANARAGRRGVPAIANVLDFLPAEIFADLVDDANAALAAYRSLPPRLRKAGPVNAADASALRLEVGARTIAIITVDPAGRARAVITAAGHEPAVLDHDEGDALWRAVAAVLRTFPDQPPSPSQESAP